MYCLENEELRVEVSPHGCELKSIFHKKSGQEVLYDGKGEWGYSDHVLFPIIAENNSFSIGGKPYCIKTRHGFCRNSDFSLVKKTDDSLTLSLIHEADDTYPFNCEILVTTRLEKNTLIRDAEVRSLDHKEMPFQYGLHPAFVCSFGEANLEVASGTILLEENQGLIKRRIPWEKGESWRVERGYIEERDTLVVTNPKGRIALHNGTGRTIALLSSCPYFAIWTPQKACKNDFLCLESWYGLSPYEGMGDELMDRDHAQKTKDTASYHDVLIIE